MITTEGGEAKVGKLSVWEPPGTCAKPFTADQIREKLT